MPRYEYKVLGGSDWNEAEEQNMSDWLTRYGREGLELTHVVPTGESTHWYLRRESQETDQ